jgi:UDP-glucose-4-epimerase GalE
MLTPLPFFENNVNGTVSILKVMKDEGVARLVFSSTAAVYGNRAGSPLLIETLPRPPKNPYGQSKLMAEMILEACVKPNNLQSVALRYFNASGADAKSRTGEQHSPETHLVPLVIETALGKRAQINIYDDGYDTPGGTCIRDYIHVTDLANAHVAAVNHLLESKAPLFTPINLGTGNGLSVIEVIDAVKQISGVDFTVVKTDRRPGDPARLAAEASLAGKILRWKAKHSSIEEIVRDAWAYAQSKLT